MTPLPNITSYMNDYFLFGPLCVCYLSLTACYFFVLHYIFRVGKENIWHVCSHSSEQLKGNKKVTTTRFEPSAPKLKLYLISHYFSSYKRTSVLICQILTADSSERIFHSLLSFSMSPEAAWYWRELRLFLLYARQRSESRV